MLSTDGINGSPSPPDHVQERLLHCNRGQHDFKVIFDEVRNTLDGFGKSTVSKLVKWCRVCGAVVIDTDVDGQVSEGGIMKMRVPQVSQAAFLEFRLSK